MTKVTLNDVANLQNETTAVNTINSNSAVIEAAFDNTLSRSGISPNFMNASLDMNSNQIINLPSPATLNSPARLSDVTFTSSPNTLVTGTFGHTIPYLDTANAWTLSQNFQSSIKMGGDTIITHPITPNPDNIATSNITLGVGAGAAINPIHSTQYLTLLGFNAGTAITTADHITAIGAWALASYTVGTAVGITAIGIDCMRAITSGISNVGVGEHTLTSATSASFCTAVGYNSMLNIGSQYNTAFGYSSMQGTVGAFTGQNNVAIGPFTLNQVTGAASSNIGIGSFAGAAITTGSNNIAIGNQTGLSVLATGSNNILIGNSIDAPLAATNNYLNIGDIIKGTSSLLTTPASFAILTGTGVSAGGVTGNGLSMSSNVNLGLYYGSGVPTLSASQGALYMRTDGSSTSTRLYVNTNGTTGWTNVTTAT